MRTTVFVVVAFCALYAAWIYAAFADAKGSPRPPVRYEQQEQPRRYTPLTDWEVLQLAIVKTESDFNPLARGKDGDCGVFQITPVFVKEVNRILGDSSKYVHGDAFDMQKSLEMFRAMQEKYNHGHDISRAIVRHNPRGDAVGYARKVRENMEWVRRYEQMRSLITEEGR